MSSRPGPETFPAFSRADRRFVSKLFRSKYYRHYVSGKLGTDPLYSAVFHELKDSELPLLDVGCGLGVLAFYLRRRGVDFPIHGIDFDEQKIAAARQIAEQHFEDVSFSDGDARTAIKNHQGNVSILDVLQYFTPEEQVSILGRAADCVAPGGKLVIRACLRDDSWRFKLNHFTDRAARWLSWMKSPPVSYANREFFQSTLGKCGLKGQFQPLYGKTPFNNHLVVFQKKG